MLLLDKREFSFGNGRGNNADRRQQKTNNCSRRQ